MNELLNFWLERNLLQSVSVEHLSCRFIFADLLDKYYTCTPVLWIFDVKVFEICGDSLIIIPIILHPLPRSRDDESCDTRIEFGGEWWFKRVIIRLKVFLNLGDTLKIFQIRVLSIQILVKIHLPWPGIHGLTPLSFVDIGNRAFSLGSPRWLLLTPVRFKSYMYFYNATGTFFHSWSVLAWSFLLIFLTACPEMPLICPEVGISNNSNEITLFVSA